MATDIEVFRGGSFESIDYAQGWEIQVPLSPAGVAPSATIPTDVDETVTPGSEVRITIDGTVRFEGVAKSGGTKRANGAQQIDAEHAAVETFEDTVSFELAGTDESVLNQALTEATGSLTLNYVGTDTLLNDDYVCENRAVKQVFRDMMDRSDKVWWVDPAGTTVTVADRGAGGAWDSFSASGDGITITNYDEGNVETVRNAVTVVGTRGVSVYATAEDATSINTYGRRPGESPYLISYPVSLTEAQALADALLQPDPLSESKVIVPRTAGAVDAAHVNETVDIADTSKGIDDDGLTVTKQVIRQGRAEIWAGEGQAETLAEANRSVKSEADRAAPGSVYGQDRIAPGAIGQQELVDLSVTQDKLADLAVALEKVQDDAISETKVQDDSISTPKLQAEAVTAAKILADTITANEIAAGTITAVQVEAGTLTANEIDTLDLDTQQLSIGAVANDGIEFDTEGANGTVMRPEVSAVDTNAFLGLDQFRWDNIYTSGVDIDDFLTLRGASSAIAPFQDNGGLVGTSTFAFSEMHSYAFIDADTGTEVSDGGDPLAGLSEGHGRPDHAAVTDDDGERVGFDMGKMLRSAWDTCREQQRRIESLEDRLETLEARIDGGGA